MSACNADAESAIGESLLACAARAKLQAVAAPLPATEVIGGAVGGLKRQLPKIGLTILPLILLI